MQGEGGLPLGVQLVGPLGDDARLLRTASWLVGRLGEELEPLDDGEQRPTDSAA